MNDGDKRCIQPIYIILENFAIIARYIKDKPMTFALFITQYLVKH